VSYTFPAKARHLVSELIDGGWSFAIKHGQDTGLHPYFTVEGIKENRKLMVTWHTRTTGTYRMSSCMGRGDSGGLRDRTLNEALSLVKYWDDAA